MDIKEYLETRNINVYPVTLIKYFLNIDKIKRIDKFRDKLRTYNIENDMECEECNLKLSTIGKLCRNHTSIDRIFHNIQEDDTLLYDTDLNYYFYKNEIFKKDVNNLYTVIYCPHTMLIKKPITSEKIKRINIFNVVTKLEINKSNIFNFSSNTLLKNNWHIWANNNFTLHISYFNKLFFYLTKIK